MPSWHQALIAFTKSGGYSAFRFQTLSQILQPTLILWGDSKQYSRLDSKLWSSPTLGTTTNYRAAYFRLSS